MIFVYEYTDVCEQEGGRALAPWKFPTLPHIALFSEATATSLSKETFQGFASQLHRFNTMNMNLITFKVQLSWI